MTNDTEHKTTKRSVPRRIERNIIAIASGKGGVGKTWFSVTLAHALARQGKRVLLFDGDLGLANVDVQLGLMAGRDISDVVEGHISLAQAITPYDEGGFDIIAGRSGQAALSALPLQRVNEILKQLRILAAEYDVVLIDLGAGVDTSTRFMASAAGTMIVVTTEDPTALTDAYALIKLSHAAGHADTAHVLINMASSEKGAERTYHTLVKACEKFLQLSPPGLGYIRQDKYVQGAIRAQTPLLTRYPNADAATDIEAVAKRVAARIQSLA